MTKTGRTAQDLTTVIAGRFANGTLVAGKAAKIKGYRWVGGRAWTGLPDGMV
jgi:hypothetical protein